MLLVAVHILYVRFDSTLRRQQLVHYTVAAPTLAERVNEIETIAASILSTLSIIWSLAHTFHSPMAVTAPRSRLQATCYQTFLFTSTIVASTRDARPFTDLSFVYVKRVPRIAIRSLDSYFGDFDASTSDSLSYNRLGPSVETALSPWTTAPSGL